MGTGMRWVGVLAGVLLAGCVATTPDAPAQPPRAELQFIDVPAFDRDLGASLGGALPRVEVGFSDRVVPSSLPTRLQRWLESVDRSGGKVALVDPPTTVAAKSPFMIIGAISALWGAQKTAREVSDELNLRSAGRYNAQLRLKYDARGDVVVDKLVFVKRD